MPPPTIFVASYYTFAASTLGLSSYMIAQPESYISQILIPFISPSRTSDLSILLALPAPQSPVVTSTIRLAAAPLFSVSLLLLISPRGTKSLPYYRLIAVSAATIAGGYAATLWVNVFKPGQKSQAEIMAERFAKELGASGVTGKSGREGGGGGSRPAFADVYREYKADTKRLAKVATIVGINMLVSIVAGVASFNVGGWADVAVGSRSRGGSGGFGGSSGGFGGGGSSGSSGANPGGEIVEKILVPLVGSVGDVFEGFMSVITGK